jgi:[ribosomal protein S18]-alanine N-acetyltransferase
LLAGADELATIPAPTEMIAVCEDAAELLLKQVWPEKKLVRIGAPTAADAIELCVPRVLAHDFADLALLDGHYLRRSDAEIFGERPRKSAAPVKANALGLAATPGFAIKVRPMRPGDLDSVIDLARMTHHAPGWPRQAYEKALDLASQPRRVALVAETAESALVGLAVASLVPPQAELETIVTAAAHQRRGIARNLFSALKNELLQTGVQEVTLEVRASNQAAQGFYRHLGFAVAGRRTAYYADPVEDAVLMRLRVGDGSEGR